MGVQGEENYSLVTHSFTTLLYFISIGVTLYLNRKFAVTFEGCTSKVHLVKEFNFIFCLIQVYLFYCLSS